MKTKLCFDFQLGFSYSLEQRNSNSELPDSRREISICVINVLENVFFFNFFPLTKYFFTYKVRNESKYVGNLADCNFFRLPFVATLF